MNLKEIERIRQIQKETIDNVNEFTARTSIIFPLLRELDWDTSDPNQLIQEYRAANYFQHTVDIALQFGGEVFIFLETKQPRSDLAKFRDQLVEYCRLATVKMGILTNGIKWEFFYVNSKSSEVQPVVSLDLRDHDLNTVEENLNALLRRENVIGGSAFEHLTAASVKSNLKIAWDIVLRRNYFVTYCTRKLKEEYDNLTNVEIPPKEIKQICSEYVDHQVKLLKAKATHSEKYPKVEYGQKKNFSGSESESKTNTKRVKPTYVVVFDKKINVTSWKEVAEKFILTLISRDPNIEPKLLSIKTAGHKKSVFFKFDNSDQANQKLRSPFEVMPTIWVSLNLSSERIINLCNQITTELNLPQDTLKIRFD